MKMKMKPEFSIHYKVIILYSIDTVTGEGVIWQENIKIQLNGPLNIKLLINI